jgi:hypothetical protein
MPAGRFKGRPRLLSMIFADKETETLKPQRLHFLCCGAPQSLRLNHHIGNGIRAMRHFKKNFILQYYQDMGLDGIRVASTVASTVSAINS